MIKSVLVQRIAARNPHLYQRDVESVATASFDSRPVTYGFGELDALVPAYAATIHKSQGSEYPAVVSSIWQLAQPAANCALSHKRPKGSGPIS